MDSITETKNFTAVTGYVNCYGTDENVHNWTAIPCPGFIEVNSFWYSSDGEECRGSSEVCAARLNEDSGKLVDATESLPGDNHWRGTFTETRFIYLLNNTPKDSK